MKQRDIAAAYITHGQRLLVMTAPDVPGAFILPPGGSVERDETPEAAALREAKEETGLDNLRLGTFLGRYEKDAPTLGEHHRCWCYHVLCSGEVPQRWEQYERDPCVGPKEPIRIELWWVELPDGVPPLGAGADQMLPALMAALERERGDPAREEEGR